MPNNRHRVSKLIRWSLLLAAVLVAVYLLSAGADTKSTRASIAPVPMWRSAIEPVPVSASAPSFSLAAQHGVQELIAGQDRAVGWNPSTGLWGGHTRPNWWQSGLALQTLVRYLERTHNTSPVFQQVIMRIYDRNHNKPSSTAKHDFANEFMDDTAWWGMAWLAAARYELYGRHDLQDAGRFLAVAEWDVRYIEAAPKVCGGIVWALRRDPDTVTSAEFIALAAETSSFRQAPGPFHDPQKALQWLDDAYNALWWLRYSGLIDIKRGFVLDRLNGGCHSYIGGPLTYSEGEMADALTQLGIAFRRPGYFAKAANFLDFTLSRRSGLMRQGILQERCESRPGACHGMPNRLDIPAFKGIFINAVSDWSLATGSKKYLGFLRDQAAAVVDNAVRDGDQPGDCSTPAACRFSFNWNDDVSPQAKSAVPMTVASQESAIDALTAVLPDGTTPFSRRRQG
jgi:Glycosyl hydrolase family 76